jgi:Predicted transcriptional regulator containing an HTH domain and an uncharacterized domain shared with the mammalian protein Schlafen
MWNEFSNILSSNNWKEYDKGITKMDAIYSLFDNILKTSVTRKKRFDKDKALNNATKLLVSVYFNDTSRGYPLGLNHPSIIGFNYDRTYLNDAYLGYVYTLQYLWYNLLSNEEYNNSCIKYLNRPEDYFKKNNEESSEWEESIKNWRILDKFFHTVNEQLVRSPESPEFDIFDIFILKVTNESHYNKFLNKNTVSEPYYLGNDDPVSMQKLIDYYLLWFEFDYLYADKSYDFNGSLSLIPLLIGAVQLNKTTKSNEKILVKKFKHLAFTSEDQSSDVNKYDYSIGVLIYRFGYDSGDCGWIISFDCATDYSGHGGYELKRINECIGKYRDIINVEEHVIEKKSFLNYLDNKSVKSRLNIQIEDEIDRTEENYWKEFILQDENDTLEFKSAIRSIKSSTSENRKLFGFPIAKTISAFLNTNGGTLIIGIDNDKKIIGLEQGYGNPNFKDTFNSDLTNLIDHYIGRNCYSDVHIKLIRIGSKHICIVKVDRSDRYYFIRDDNDIKHFFIRHSARSKPLDIEETHEYISRRF